MCLCRVTLRFLFKENFAKVKILFELVALLPSVLREVHQVNISECAHVFKQ